MARTDTAPHRSARPSERKVWVSSEVDEALDRLSEQHCLTKGLVVEQLIDFFEMRSLDLLITKIKSMTNRPLNVEEIAYMSVLFTLMVELDRRIGLK